MGTRSRSPLYITWHAILALVVVLGGCANPHPMVETKSLGSGQGVVTLRVVSLHPRTLRQLTIVNEATGEEVLLRPLPALGGNSYRFTGVAAAGRYSTKVVEGSDIEQDAFGTWDRTLKAPLAAPANVFQVAAGHLTNLGTIVIAPLSGAQFGRFVSPREGTPVAALEWLRSANPELAASINADRELGWAMADDDPAAKDKLRYAEQHAAALSPVVFDAGGSLWNGGKLGLVFERTPEGTKRRYYAGTVQQITSVSPLSDGRVLVAGEEGYVAVSNADRTSWREAPSPASKASVALLVAQPSANEVVLVSRTPRGVIVYTADPVNLAWKELRRIEPERPASHSSVPLANGGAAAVMTSERLVVYTRDPDLLSSFDLRSRTWEQFKAEPSVNSIWATPDGLVLVRGSSLWTWGTIDYGKTWRKLDTDYAHLNPAFSDRLSGYTISKPFTILEISRPALRKTTDGGKTWTAIGTLPASNWYGVLLYDHKRQRLGFSGKDGSLLWSEDEGKSWR